MAEKILQTRIQLKYDTYANWTTNNPVLKAGEVAIATVPTGDANNVSTSLPAVLMKVGDGTSNYNALPFLSAKAADVYAYAKKPEADFIAWIKNIIATEGAYDTKGSAAQALADAKAYADGKDTAISDAKSAADAAQVDVDALEAKVGTVSAGKTVVEMISDAQTAATYDDTALAGRVTTVEGKVTTLIGSDASKSARTIASEEVAKIVAGADTAYDTLKEIADWISSHKTDATAMNSAIVALEAIVDGIGDTEAGEKATVVAYVTDAIAAINIGDYAKAADLTALAGRVTTLEGKAHEHGNKAVLDGITAEKVTKWDEASAAIEGAVEAGIATLDYTDTAVAGQYVNKVSQTDGVISVERTEFAKATTTDYGMVKYDNTSIGLNTNNQLEVKAVNTNLLFTSEGDVLVFDCGGSN